jgi:hypothetical protein
MMDNEIKKLAKKIAAKKEKAPKRKKSKYNSKKVVIDGKKFDSMLEGSYYNFLKLEKESGKIRDFSLQPVFLLIDGFTRDGKKYQKTEYISDFKVICNDGVEEIIDTKGVLTGIFRIKAKLLLSLYDINFFIVKNVNGRFVKTRF